MIRDFDLIRNILFQIEAAPAGMVMQSPVFALEKGVGAEVFGQHVQLLFDAGLVDGKMIDADEPMFVITRLTWEGHEFLNNARNDTVWKKVMSDAKEKGTSMTMVVLNGLLSKFAQKYAGLS